MNLLIFRDLCRIFLNFYEFILNLFGILKLDKSSFLLHNDVAANVASDMYLHHVVHMCVYLCMCGHACVCLCLHVRLVG